MKARSCKEAGGDRLHAKRPAPWPGPRCASCHRAKRKADAKRAADNRLVKVYGVTVEQYEAMYAAQGGRCAVCRKATGKARRLAVDHNHATGEPRGLVCGPCNILIGKLADDPAAFEAIANYLRHPTWRRLAHPDPVRSSTEIRTPPGGITLAGTPLMEGIPRA